MGTPERSREACFARLPPCARHSASSTTTCLRASSPRRSACWPRSGSRSGARTCASGCSRRASQLDAGGERILFPPDVVDAAVASAPSSFTLYDRAGRPHAELGRRQRPLRPRLERVADSVDHRTGETRLATTTDFVEFVRLADGLEHVAYLATAFSTHDVPAEISDAWRLALCLMGSERPVVSGAFTEHGVPRMVELMQLFRADRDDLIARPLSIFTVTATGSFRYGEDSCQNLVDCVEAGIPIEIVPVTLMGLIAPVTLVGATVFHTADVLAGVTMAQLVRPGAPVLFGGAPAAFHMKAASSPMAAIEALHLDVAYVEVGKALGLPTQAYMALSDARVLDAQAGAETFGSALLAALAGVNSVSGPGMLDYVLAFSLAEARARRRALRPGAAPARARSSRRDDLPVTELVAPPARREAPDHGRRTRPRTGRASCGSPGRRSTATTASPGSEAAPRTSLTRATEEVDRRLAAYRPPETDGAVVDELVAIVRAGHDDLVLPEPPPLPDGEPVVEGPRRRRNRRRPRPEA